jgi:hypothetical protein
VVKRHDNSIRRVTARDNGYIGIGNGLIDNGLQAVASFRKINDSHDLFFLAGALNRFGLYMLNKLYKYRAWMS